ncbi:hypothetical protein EAI_14038 [Harpegnathos saltator]|uniref:Uncharacterized protein n=1 Tax=Harpegnathos saltator TaxID=610380 RepID=E2BYR0_HARSA|nr:hypothetical protein EAI_14038 [Harpegnathos saltator]
MADLNKKKGRKGRRTSGLEEEESLSEGSWKGGLFGTPASELLRFVGSEAMSEMGVEEGSEQRKDSDDGDPLSLSEDEEELGAVGGKKKEEEVEYPPYSAKRWGEWKEYLREQIEEWGMNRSLGNLQKGRLREVFSRTLQYSQELVVAAAAMEDRVEKIEKKLLISETCRKELCGYMEEITAQSKAIKGKKNRREAEFEKERAQWKDLLEKEREGTAQKLQALERNLTDLDNLFRRQEERGLGEGVEASTQTEMSGMPPPTPM